MKNEEQEKKISWSGKKPFLYVGSLARVTRACFYYEYAVKLCTKLSALIPGNQWEEDISRTDHKYPCD